MMKRLTDIFLLITAVIIALTTGLFSSHCRAETYKNETFKLIILHTNDLHGNLLPYVDKSKDNHRLTGGSAYMAGIIKKIKNENPGHTLLLDAGDIAQGTPISNIFRGKPVIEVMNNIGYEAMTLGNHEFDWGQECLNNIINWADFPILSANTVISGDTDSPLPGVKPFIIKQVGPVRVGILGLTIPSLSIIPRMKMIPGMKFLSPEKTAEKYIPEMKKEGAQIIVVLSHLGISGDEKLAQKADGIDVIVGGHSHIDIYEPRVINDTLVVQAGAKGQFVGRLDLYVDADSGSIRDYSKKGVLIPVNTSELEPDPEVKRIVDKYEDEIRVPMSRVVGFATGDMRKFPSKGYGDSAMGNLMTDYMRKETGSQVAFQNTGGIRQNLYGGDIAVEDLFQTFPFDNNLVTFEMTGEDLIGLLLQKPRSGDILQVSGLTYTLNLKKKGADRIENLMVGGKPIDKTQVYTITTVDYLFLGGDKLNFEKARNPVYGDNYRDVFMKWVEKESRIEPPPSGRIIITD